MPRRNKKFTDTELRWIADNPKLPYHIRKMAVDYLDSKRLDRQRVREISPRKYA